MPPSPPSTNPELDDILRDLVAGRGRERVNDGNVKALIDLAEQRGHPLVAQLLREWSAPCG
ncbi:hypothetical protein GTZ97_15620 [Aquabacterium fontiphilum]|jgi:hypothetical protein|uniref:hypothetical protein n=1 Tax=Aquabacterium fontiphilum TaxID=450365 RepID=UPI00137872E2|nr:hypothetical protein [Aquabacterium fontiphilum]NBD22089.1 hypothetical protein [Aquabacterium fontiphilum]